jgi:putative glycosyltransferase (TIGR04372 family)
MRIKNIFKKTLKYNKVSNAFIFITKAQYSSSKSLRFCGNLIAATLFIIFKERYFRLLMLVNSYKSELTKPAKPANSLFLNSFLPEPLLIRVMTNDQSVIVDDYEKCLIRAQLSPRLQLDISKDLMWIGRLDIARVGFIELINRDLRTVPAEMRLESLRYAGITSFLFSKNEDATYYFRLTGEYRRSLYKSSTPRKYRILGPGWFSALGHVCILDYYLKFITLYCEADSHIVIPCTPDQVPAGPVGKIILNKFSALGLHVIHPDALEADYNNWAGQNHFPLWHQLQLGEKAAMVDDCWDYNFPDGESLCFVHALHRIQKDWEKAGYSPLFTLSPFEKIRIADYLKSLGVPKDAWYVCLHVREPGFHHSWDKLYPSMRDADINDYSLAIKEIVKAGGWVIRMGDPSMKPLPPMRNVVDYAHSSLRTPLADVLLLAGCRFFMATNSGYVNIASMYYVPCALTNWVPLGGPLPVQQDLMIPKLLKNKITDKYLSLEEMYQTELAFVMNWSELPADIELVPNSPEELACMAKEMLAQCDSRYSHSKLIADLPRSLEQEYYEELALSHSSYTGPRLAKFFTDKYNRIFSRPSVAECQHEINEMAENILR